LFGYEKGAFTGATSSKPGRFGTPTGAASSCDEIGELPLPLQSNCCA
jgi:transcriptional regulator with GAF, ATPase, and Fis domain